MKTTVLIIALISGCITSVYSQINQKSRERVDSLSSFRYDIKPALGFKKLTMPGDFRDDKLVEPFLSDNSSLSSSTTEATVAPAKMPCYKPEGVFSMRVIKPDSTMRYSMLVKRY